MNFRRVIGKHPRTQVDTVSRQMLVRTPITSLRIGQAVCYDDTILEGVQPGVVGYTAAGKFAGFICYQADNVMDDETKPDELKIITPGSVHVLQNGPINLKCSAAVKAGDILEIDTNGLTVKPIAAALAAGKPNITAEAAGAAGSIIPCNLRGLI